MRLVEIWAYDLPYQHTTIDDLESFLWLLLWCIFCIIEEKGKLDRAEARHLKQLRSTDIESHINGRPGILATIQQTVKRRTASAMVEKFQPLLFEWHKISTESSDIMFALQENPTPPDDDHLYKLTYEYFGDFLAKGNAHLKNLPTSWDEIFAGRPPPF